MPRADVGTHKVERKVYRGTKGGGPAFGTANVRWYEQPDDRAWEYSTGRVRQIKQRQTRRRYELAVWQNLYMNTGAFYGSSLFRANGLGAQQVYRRLRANVIRSIIDTGQARIAKDETRVFVTPNSSDSRIVTKADKLTKFLDGAFVGGCIYEENKDVFRDGCIYGDGYILFEERDAGVAARALKVDEVTIDELDGMYNRPKEVHWEHPTPRTELLAEYSQFAEEIEEARGAWRGDMGPMAQADLVLVTHSWRLPSRDPKGKTPPGRATEGRHVVAINGATLFSEEWDRDYLPILRWQWSPPTYGAFGIGIACELEGMQRAIDEILRNVMRGFHLFAVPRVWVEKMSQVSQKSLTNDISVNCYTGEKPVFETPPAASPDTYQFLEWLIDWCFKQTGFSQLTAQSEKPAGLNSGVAMRTYQDVETQRFAVVGQRWERFHLEEARVVLDMSARIYKRKGALSANVAGRSFVETIDWRDASLRDDQYDLQAFPTSLLPRTPEGQLQSVQELINSGFMPKDVALSQLRIPNLDAWIREQTASRDNINMALSMIRDKGRYVPPNGIADVDSCVTMAMSAWLRGELDEHMQPERKELLLRFLNEALDLQAAKQAPANAGASPVVGQAPAPAPAPLAAAGSGPVTAAAA